MSTRSGGEPPATTKAERITKPDRITKPAVQPRAAATARPARPANKVEPTPAPRAARTTPTPTSPSASARESEREDAQVQAEVEAVQLCLVRHSDAGDPGEWPGDDADRPLSAKGRRQARRLASLLADVGFRPHLMLTSPKVRATQTARILGRALGVDAEEDERLGGPFGLELIGNLLVDHAAAKRVLLVGHDPEFSAVTSALVGVAIEVRKGALVRIDLLGRSPRRGAGNLRWLLPPGLLRG